MYVPMFTKMRLQLAGTFQYVYDAIYISDASIKSVCEQPLLICDGHTSENELCSLDVSDTDKGAPIWMKEPANNYMYVHMQDTREIQSHEYI